ncbi:hypothetical protein C7M84_015545 [Penaeus vannamei]|uniref:Uncharacterized protein n=1 Tax=Penaeus vannamei TaxID=6689 RepID=A0A3R7PH89_PENVA|nr:hypothetical protein C7M84_015545 [Penaeus vannamei]
MSVIVSPGEIGLAVVIKGRFAGEEIRLRGREGGRPVLAMGPPRHPPSSFPLFPPPSTAHLLCQPCSFSSLLPSFFLLAASPLPQSSPSSLFLLASLSPLPYLSLFLLALPSSLAFPLPLFSPLGLFQSLLRCPFSPLLFLLLLFPLRIISLHFLALLLSSFFSFLSLSLHSLFHPHVLLLPYILACLSSPPSFLSSYPSFLSLPPYLSLAPSQTSFPFASTFLSPSLTFLSPLSTFLFALPLHFSRLSFIFLSTSLYLSLGLPYLSLGLSYLSLDLPFPFSLPSPTFLPPSPYLSLTLPLPVSRPSSPFRPTYTFLSPTLSLSLALPFLILSPSATSLPPLSIFLSPSPTFLSLAVAGKASGLNTVLYIDPHFGVRGNPYALPRLSLPTSPPLTPPLSLVSLVSSFSPPTPLFLLLPL